MASPLKWGKPAWAAYQLLLRALDEDEKRLWLWALNLSADKNPYTRRYATWLLEKLWKKHRNRAGHILQNLADDKDWIVREYAHDAWGNLLKNHFHQIYPILKKWAEHSSPNLRRCVVKAARTAGNTRKKEWAEPLIHLIEPLLSDRTVYVRKNLGSYAIGDGLLRCYPTITIKHLHRWADSEDEGTLWNVAMAFASYGGNKNWREGIKILTELATDERRYVWRAVASACLYLARRREEVKGTLKSWLNDPRRMKVAETALTYLKD
ncbi:MAG: hypothetical protein ACETWE_03810 [Candidatus Bathyarchaeia archaeon]